MLRPYGWVLDTHDAVNVVWHDNKFIKKNVSEMLWNCTPRLERDLSNIIQDHLPIQNLAKQMRSLRGADRDEIRAARGVIVVSQPRAVAVQRRVHVCPASVSSAALSRLYEIQSGLARAPKDS